MPPSGPIEGTHEIRAKNRYFAQQRFIGESFSFLSFGFEEAGEPDLSKKPRVVAVLRRSGKVPRLSTDNTVSQPKKGDSDSFGRPVPGTSHQPVLNVAKRIG